jgi:hypothetical protein
MKDNISSKHSSAFLPHHVIAERAYAIWLARGRPMGCDYDHWVEARRQLQAAAGPAGPGAAVRLTNWSDLFSTDIERALDSFAPRVGPRSPTSL